MLTPQTHLSTTLRFIYISVPGARPMLEALHKSQYSKSYKNSAKLRTFLVRDVHLNTGPGPKYPCSECDKSVSAHQHGLYCEVCFSWAHRLSISTGAKSMMAGSVPNVPSKHSPFMMPLYQPASAVQSHHPLFLNSLH